MPAGFGAAAAAPAPASPAARSARARSGRGRPDASPGRRGRRGWRRRAGSRRQTARAAASSAGSWPSSGTSRSTASCWPPPSPKIWKRSPDGVTKPDMFSIDAADLELELGRHLGRAGRHLLGHRLRRGDDQELRLRQQLGERHRDVAGAGRQVDEQVVERAPLDVLQELLQRLVEHRAAPYDGGVLLDEEADRHHLDAVEGVDRDQLALSRRPSAARRRARASSAVNSPTRPHRARRPPCPRRRAPRRGWR